MATQKRLTILLTTDEHAELRKRAGLVPMGTWIKAELRLTEKQMQQYTDFKGASELPESPKISKPRPVQRSVPSRGGRVEEKQSSKKSSAYCTHGIMKMGRCSACPNGVAQ